MPGKLLVLVVCAVVPSALACTPARAVEAKPGAAEMRTVSHAAAPQDAQVDASIPTPESVIGHKVGADYKLARWEKIVEYFQKLAAASDRIAVRQIDEELPEACFTPSALGEGQPIEASSHESTERRHDDEQRASEQPRGRLLAHAE